MQNYIRYEIEQRKHSSNVVLGVYTYMTDKGEKKEKSEIILVPTLKKEDGDQLATTMYNFLNSPD